MATVWRWPPESEATTSRTLGMRAASSLRSVQALHLHRHLVEVLGVELAAEEDVADDVEVLAEREVLEDGGDAERRARRSGSDSDRLARGSGSSPEVGGWTPARTLTSVDLPAPLSPTSATTSPAWTSSSMSVSAETAPKFLQMPRRLRIELARGGSSASLDARCRSCRAGFRLEGPPGARLGRAVGRSLDAELLAAVGVAPVQTSAALAMPLSKISALMLSRVTTTGMKSSEGVL